jgi:peptidoglycan hydrolase-like protein with peptidoglycan-binding domain
MISRRIAWSLALAAALSGGFLNQPSVRSQPSPAAFVPIEQGSNGPRVTELQVLLGDLGYYKGDATGQFDEATASALGSFQASQQLTESRILDAATWDRLRFTQSSPVSPAPGLGGVESTPQPTVQATAQPPSTATAGSSLAKAAGKSSTAAKVPAAAHADGRLRLLMLGTAGLGLGAGCYGFVRTSRRKVKPKAKQVRARSLTPSINPAVSSAIPASTTEVVSPLVDKNRDSGWELDRDSNVKTAIQSLDDSAELSEADYEKRDYEKRDYEQRDYEKRDYGVTRSASRLPRIDIVEALMVDLQSVDAEKRRKAIWELGQRGDSRAVQPLVNLMAISDSRQRSLILASLSEIGIQTLKPMKRALAMSLQDDNADVRKNAIRDLTRIYDLVGQISQLLNFATEDNDGEVRETAQWALGQLSRIRSATPEATPLLQQSISPPELFSDDIKRDDPKRADPKREDVKLQERSPDYES